ncbi:MAG TPA: ubiquinone/menaquinone biosynthesis methyltransferase [Terriglobales bacterium]|jgi:demethylmenaquinone methyltransferase/2-methoxy-6-polyprenyl-1,4-benzoquinol methylase
MNENQTSKAAGASPSGAESADAAAHAVQRMFDDIAPRYDLLNHVLSANIDRVWWRRTAKSFGHILLNPQARILDLCCGTGDMTMALHAHRPANALPILAADFSHQMLARGAAKFVSRHANVVPVEADALNLPFPAAQFDLVVSAFGFRNLADYGRGLDEIARVLAPGGEIGILDFSEPKGLLGRLYRIYFQHVLPRIGALLSGNRAAYEYLPASVQKFPAPAEMLTRMREAGFAGVSWKPYSFGIAGLYRGTRR